MCVTGAYRSQGRAYDPPGTELQMAATCELNLGLLEEQ